MADGDANDVLLKDSPSEFQLSLSQLRRFLYLGSETVWKAASKHDFTSVDGEMTIIQKMVGWGVGVEAVQEIAPLISGGSHIDPEVAAYALAAIRQSPHVFGPVWSSKSALEVLCKSAIPLFAFIHYNEKLSSPKTGWGRGVRNLVADWYNKKNARDLAEEVTKFKSSHGWSHKDLLCLAHVKAKKTDTAAVLKYIVKGIEAAENEFGEEEEAKEVLTYLKAVHELQHTTDIQTAARLIEMHNLCYEHVPTKLLKSKEIWTCLIPRLKLPLLLKQLPRLHKLGLLKLNSPHLKQLLERVRDKTSISEQNLGPFEAFLTIRRWEAANGFVPWKPIIRQNLPQLNEALLTLYHNSFKTLSSTEKRYLVALDVGNPMVLSHTAGCSCLAPADVCAVVLMALSREEGSNVNAVAFSMDSLVPFDINNKMSITDITMRMRNTPMGRVNLALPVKWALQKSKPIDVFIIFTDKQTTPIDIHPSIALKDYQDSLNLPNTKFITCALCSRDFSLSPTENNNMLDIAGFNVKLLEVIKDFARGVF